MPFVVSAIYSRPCHIRLKYKYPITENDNLIRPTYPTVNAVHSNACLIVENKHKTLLNTKINKIRAHTLACQEAEEWPGSH